MSFCSNPYSLISVDLNELIGKSLNTINTNFSLIKEQICLEDIFLNQFENKCQVLESKISSFQQELQKTPSIFINFTGNGNILNQKGVSSVSRISLGVYRINFSSPQTNYILGGSLVSLTSGFISIISETSTFVTLNVRQHNGNLFDPEKISLVFFT
jgi:hypothetical protein